MARLFFGVGRGFRIKAWGMNVRSYVEDIVRPPSHYPGAQFYRKTSAVNWTPMAFGDEGQWVVQGNIGLSLTPAATMEGPPEPQRLYERGQIIIKGAVFLSEFGTHISADGFLDESGIETNMQPSTPAGQWTVFGDISMSLSPGIPIPVVDRPLTGSVSIIFTPGAASTPQYITTGNILSTLLPGATITRQWTVTGSLLTSLTPGASAIANYVLNGNVLTSLIPGSTVAWERIVAGSIPLSLLPSSQIIEQWYVLGNILTEFMPSEDFQYEAPGVWERIVDGSVLFSLVPTSPIQPQYVVGGNLSVSFLPGSTCVLVFVANGNLSLVLLVSSIFSTQFPGEDILVMTGDILFTLRGLSEILLIQPDYSYENQVDKTFPSPDGVYDSQNQIIKSFESPGGWFDPHPMFFGDSDEDFNYETLGERRN